jgi:hypothetical protein
MKIVRHLFAVACLTLLGGVIEANAMPRSQAKAPSAPTYTVFATREGLVGHRTANGHTIRKRDRFVALPSFGVLSSKGGSEFQVRVTYKGRSAVLPVWDVGPWNTRDDYWSPKRRYGDLPVGKPMAQAAYQSGYNKGRDEFGRRIQAPNGIDIADGAFWDDLGMADSDWVQVTFLWLGSDSGASAADAVPPKTDQTALEPGASMVDNGDTGFTSRADLRWGSDKCGQGGQAVWTYGTSDPAKSTHSARWSAQLAGVGYFEAMAYIPKCGRTLTRAARYRVWHGDSAAEVTVDQHAAAGGWVSLGLFRAEGGPVAVELSDLTGDRGAPLYFDAVKWVPRADSAPPDARVRAAARQPDGDLLVQWNGSDDVSGVASYDVQVRRLPDGPWQDWQRAATGLAAPFRPPEPGGYAFRARARDWLGHEQLWRDGDDLAVTVE